jgi:hypothetical protein
MHQTQRLQCIWLATAVLLGSIAESARAQAVGKPSAQAELTFAYPTQAGDTLIGLGQRFLTRPQDWTEVAKLNHVTHTRQIPVGTVLRIPEHLMRSQSRDGQILDAVGTSTLQLKGQSTPSAVPAKRGAPVAAGSVIRTGANGYVTVQLADGSILKIQADTEARLDQSQQFESAGFFSSMWSVMQGRVEALVTHLTGGEPRFRIKTPQAVLGVRGTEFRVDTDVARAQTRGETLTGAVGVRGKDEALVKAGYGTLVDTTHQVAAPRPLPPAPDLSGQPHLHERILVRMDMPAVTGAVRYFAQVADDASFQRVREQISSATPVLRFAGLPDGDYVVRARSIDASGMESADAIHRFKLKARPEAPIPHEPAPKSKWRAASINFSWADHPQAQHYRIQVAGPDGFAAPVVDQPGLKEPHLTLSLPPGDYLWRVGTVAAGEDAGPWGDALSFSVRAMPAPAPPARIGQRDIHLQLIGEPGQRFECQLAHDDAFTDLVSEVASGDGQITLPKPPEGGRLRLRYRAIDADGYVGPYTATQFVVLPSCVRTGSGQCLANGDGVAASPP